MGSIDNPQSSIPYTDVLIVGAGFGAFAVLNRLRKLGLHVKIYEKGQSAGGIWYWNCYPGARVDSESPVYQLFDKELYEDFCFKERYPDWRDLQRYFRHVVKKWNTEEHTEYNTLVESAHWDDNKHLWWVSCADGKEIYARWFIPCLGFASKYYRPPFPGLGSFEGQLYHTAYYPPFGVNLKGKRVALVGTGASGIQVAQEIGDSVKHLTIYQRTPNLCLPMKQWNLDPAEETRRKNDGEYERIFETCRHTFTGFNYDFISRPASSDTEEQRQAHYDKLMNKDGGFRMLIGNYNDTLKDEWSNDQSYNFWRTQVLKRVKNPDKQRLLAPEKKPHPFGAKRCSLETRFYEVVDQDHIDIIDINQNPIEEVTAKGLRTRNGVVEVDILILATGFDSVTGSLGQLDIQGVNNETISEHWSEGTRTAIGISLHNFPNMFFLYGPQAPTAFANGPSCTQFQAEFVEETIKRCMADQITKLNATKESEDDWVLRVNKEWYSLLYPKANGWYTGANIPNKKIEPLNWIGGLPAYLDTLYKSIDNDFQGWEYGKVDDGQSGIRSVDGKGEAAQCVEVASRSIAAQITW